MVLSTKYLVSDSGTYANTPDHASFDVTGDFEVRFDVDIDVLGTNHLCMLFNRFDNPVPDRMWRFRIRSDKNLAANILTTADNKNTDFSVGWADATRYQIRIEIDMDNGAGSHAFTRYSRTGANLADLADNSNWTTVGTTTLAHGGNTTLQTGVGAISFGGDPDGPEVSAGKLYRAQFFNNIGGTLVADFNADDFSHGDGDTATAVDSVGRTWTINGTGTIVDPSTPSGAPEHMLLLGVG